MGIELVIFDLAGTTVADADAVPSCFREALAAAGLEVSAEAVREVRGLPKREALRLLIERSGQRDRLIDQVEAIHADFVARIQQFYRTDPAICEVPGTSETFRRLRAAGIKVALDTGFSRDIVRLLLDRVGWLQQGLVDASVTSDEVPRGRPHPDMIRCLMAELGVQDPLRVAKVGDTPADLQEGQNAGCGMVIGVTRGSHTREQLQQHPHTHLIGTVAELPALVLGARRQAPGVRR
jgi:phosphonatase-like hydrolase